MKTHQTIAGNAYVVYSKDGCTVTDSTGTLNKEVPAGDFLTIPAPSDALITSDDNALVRKANFKRAALALGLLGGGNNGLPAGYTRVEYIEGNAYAYIDSQVGSSDDIEVKAELYFTPNKYGETHTVANNAGTLSFKIAGNSYARWGGLQNIRVSGRLYAPKTRNEFILRKGYAQFGSASGSFVAGSFAENPTNATILINHVGGLMSDKTAINRWFNFNISENTKKKRAYIPALDPTGAPCLYDLVSRKPFFNSGTGDFSYPGKETTATTYSLRRPRMYAQKTGHGIRRLYHVPRGYNGTPEEYAAENGFKILVETPQPEEGYWAPVWHEREDCIELEWVETEPPAEELSTIE